jgi:hypothetical protein
MKDYKIQSVWTKAKDSSLKTIKNKLKLKGPQIPKKPRPKLSYKKTAFSFRIRLILFANN